MGRYGCPRTFWLVAMLLGVLVAGGLFVGPPEAAALGDAGGTVEDSLCLQRLFMGPTGTKTSANALNCSAKDIKFSKAISAINLDQAACGPDGDPCHTQCIEGTSFTLQAVFETPVTANARYDAGFVFRIDGGPNARGDGANATGSCSLSWLTVPPNTGYAGIVQQLDGDSCGDLNAGTYNLQFTIPNVACNPGDPDTNGVRHLRLPNCTTWHSNAGTACTLPTSASDSHVFDFHPHTNSKCYCDDT
jgi:hypothetical protein